MNRNFKAVLRLFFQLKRYSIAVIVLSFSSLLYLLYLVFTTKHDSFNALSLVADASFYPLILLLVVDFIYFRIQTDSDTEEVLDSITSGKPSTLLMLFLVRFSILLIAHCFLLSGFYILSQVRDFVPFFRERHLLIAYSYNIFLPSFVFLVMSFGLSRMTSKTRASLIILITAILTSPVSSFFHATAKSKLPIDRVIDFVIYPFTFIYSRGGRTPNPLYGLHIELNRLLLMGGICLLMVGILYHRYAKSHRKTKIFISLFLSLLFFVSAYQPNSTFRHNLKWNGIYKDLFIIRDIHDQLIPWSPGEEPDYEIKSYRLQINRGLQLAVDAKINVLGHYEQKDFKFTLYRGYTSKN